MHCSVCTFARAPAACARRREWTSGLIGLLVLASGGVGPGCATGQRVSAPSQPTAFTLIDPRVDHVLVSLPSACFDELSDFLAREFGNGWIPNDKEHKGFIFASENSTYVEVWDSGGIPYPLGYQVAISSSDIEDGRRKATAYYGHAGKDWTPMGTVEVFTVGSDYHVGDPFGGTFFVSYSGLPTSAMLREGSPVAALVKVVTAVPRFRMDEVETYKAFGFSDRAVAGGVEFTDEVGISVRILERADTDVESLGHLAIQFRLSEPVVERREVDIGESGSLKAVFDAEHLWLLLRSDLYDPFEPTGAHP